MADIEEELRRQAENHGLRNYGNSQQALAERKHEDETREQLQLQQLANFSGLRQNFTTSEDGLQFTSATADAAEEKRPTLNWASYTAVEQLQELGMERLKGELQLRGLKCGGTLQQRASGII